MNKLVNLLTCKFISNNKTRQGTRKEKRHKKNCKTVKL